MFVSPPSRDELIAHHVLESVDRVSGDRETTAFKQRARLHQALWRKARGLPEGTEPTRPRPGARSRPIGSRLEINFAFQTGANFLTDGARAAAQHRIAHPEPKQTLNPDRLYADLLSSMPMCFNLFGPLWEDSAFAGEAIRRWWPDAPARLSAIRFEWSPGRQIPGRLLGEPDSLRRRVRGRERGRLSRSDRRRDQVSRTLQGGDLTEFRSRSAVPGGCWLVRRVS